MTFQVNDILALIDSPDNVGDNWRVIRPYTRLRQTGVNARWAWGDDAVLPTDPERTVLVVRLMTGRGQASIDQWLAERRPLVRAIVYELDDIAWGTAMTDHLEGADFMQGKPRDAVLFQGEMARYLASRCDGVITSSEPLTALVRQDANANAVTVPNAIDTRWFRAQMAHRAPWADHPTIGWCGGRRPDADVAMMAEAWSRVARRYPSVRFVVASSLIPEPIRRAVPTDQVIALPWVSWEDSPVLYQTDIGCVSVADSPFSRAKTPIKCWEYAVAGAAVVGTPTLYGPCLAYGLPDPVETAEEWDDALSYLIERSDARRAHQTAMAAHVEEHHALDTQLHRWPAALAEVVAAAAKVPI